MSFRLLLLCTFLLGTFTNPSQGQTPPSTTTVVVIGDSISAGYGVKKEEAYPALVERKLKEKGASVKIINGAESGALSSASLGRLKFYHKRLKPEIVLLAIGGNDARAKKPVHIIKANLKKAIEFALQHDIKLILGGQKIFSNYGPEYGKAFEDIYKELAQTYKIPLIPFMLEGVGGVKSLNISDGFHPNAQGHKKIAETVLPFILEEI